jgi:hypothetical protein
MKLQYYSRFGTALVHLQAGGSCTLVQEDATDLANI